MSVNRKELKPPMRDGKGIVARAALQVAGGAIPFAGGLLSAIASEWGEREQDKWHAFLLDWMQMIEAELREKQTTMIEIMSRLDLKDEVIDERVNSEEYKVLLRKAFREWGGAESEKKREYIRNVLTNAAASSITSDDVVRLFIEWISRYSEMHFLVIAEIYNNDGITRGRIWSNIGKGHVREDSAEADLYKLLFRDLSTGGIVRQHRETDYYGNFKKKSVTQRKGDKSPLVKSAFDNDEGYELTALGKQFVHYAMTDLPIRIEM